MTSIAAVVLLAALALGCGGTAVKAGPRPAAECVIGDTTAPATVSVGVAHAPDAAHAPAPRSAAERMIFRQLYETLVRVDCAGTVLPGLAESWTAQEQGATWEFRLRAGAAFSDGSPVTARAIVESWSATEHVADRMTAAFGSVTALGERDLRVELRAPVMQPYIFAHPDFAVARRAADTRWPIGSGPFRVDSVGARVIRLVLQGDRTRTGAPASIAFHIAASADARAALDAGMDVVVTADPVAVDYARALSGYTVTPLPWTRTYVLATRDRSAAAAADTLIGPPADALFALARDAVRAGARAAVAPFWWDNPACPPMPRAPAPQRPMRSGRGAIVYPRDDAVARAIAERLVALAWPAARAPAWLRARLPRDYAAAGAPVATAVEERAVLDSLRGGHGLAFVVPLARSPVLACAAAFGDGSAEGTLIGASGWRLTPLLDARDDLVHHQNVGQITVESDGTPLFTGGAAAP